MLGKKNTHLSAHTFAQRQKKLSCFTRLCLHHGSRLWRQIAQTVCIMAACSVSSPPCSQELSWDLHSPSLSLMRAVIILCTGPDNPANEDHCEMKKPFTPLRVLCCSLNHKTQQHDPSAFHPPGFELQLILHFLVEFTLPIILQIRAVPQTYSIYRF